VTKQSISRRRFLKSTAGLAGASLAITRTVSSAVSEQKLTASDQVPLGKTGLSVSRLGIGTGSMSGRVQRALGHDGFDRLIRYAYDHGITHIDTADGYQTHPWIRRAIKDLPREKFFITTKMGGRPEDPLKELDRFRKELGVDYIDSVLIHCKIHGNWDETHKRLIDAFEEAKHKQIIRSHGVSCHSLPALRKATALKWVDVNLVRVNPQAVKIDTEKATYFDDSKPKHLEKVVDLMGKMRENGHGVVGMKIIGEGDFTRLEDRKKSIRFAMQPGLLDGVVIGFKNTAEIDEAMQNMNEALAG